MYVLLKDTGVALPNLPDVEKCPACAENYS